MQHRGRLVPPERRAQVGMVGQILRGVEGDAQPAEIPLLDVVAEQRPPSRPGPASSSGCDAAQAGASNTATASRPIVWTPSVNHSTPTISSCAPSERSIA